MFEDENGYLDMNEMKNKTKHTMEDNNNTDKRNSMRYEDMTGSQGFDSLIPPEASYENANRPSRVVELDEDGNEIGELPSLSKPRLPSRYISIEPREEGLTDSLVPSPGVEEEQICLGPGAPDDVDGGYLEPHNHLYEEIKEVKKTMEVTPTGSRIVTVEEKTRRIPLMRRLTSRISGKPISADDDHIKCTCSKKMLLIALCIVLIVILVITVIVVMVVVVQKPESESERASKSLRRDVIFPTLTCPKSTTVTLSDYKRTVILDGADARDNIGIASLEYIPQIVDNSAVHKVPDQLILSQSSVDRNYTVLVKTRDVDDNEAECRYHVAVKEDPCVPWRLPVAAYSTRKAEKTSQGWSVTYECTERSSSQDDRTPQALSYYYLDSAVTFTCTTGTDFTPKKRFSCQSPAPALYSYVTSLNYQYLDHDGRTKLQNITREKATSCFEDYYKEKLVAIQQTLSGNLEEDIVQVASRNSVDLSAMELVPSVLDHPRILEYEQNNGRVQAMNIALGYQVGPAGQAFPTNGLNVFVKSTLRKEHNVLFIEEMLPFSRLKGNVATGCPDVQAPSASSIFDEVSSGFSCHEGEKEHQFYDAHLNSELTVCLGCPVGEYYSRVTGSCEECAVNTYQDMVGTMECKLCPLNKKTDKTGARSIQECVPV